MYTKLEKYYDEARSFISELSERLGHPEEEHRSVIILRAVLHSIRDRLTMSESLDLLAQLPMFLKGFYVENWQYREKPVKITTLDEFSDYVKKYQAENGERDFDWKESTLEIIETVLDVLTDRYITKGELEDIISQMPENLKELFRKVA
jgi:uncharacterized protein (DUF2267 family)